MTVLGDVASPGIGEFDIVNQTGQNPDGESWDGSTFAVRFWMLAAGLTILGWLRAGRAPGLVALVALLFGGAQEGKAAAWANAGDWCANMNPGGAAAGWDAWMQAKPPDPRAKATKGTPPVVDATVTDWAVSAADNTVRVTPAWMNATTPFQSEGPYCRTIDSYGNFYLSIQYLAVPGRVTPKGPKGTATDQDFGNSGIYIYDRWEVQIIDPAQFDDPATVKAYPPPPPGVPQGKTILADTRIMARLDKMNNPLNNQLNTNIPGSLYGVDPVNPKAAGGNVFLNQGNPAGQWNTLVVNFCAPVVTAGKITTAPQLSATLNGTIVYYGNVAANGTGSKAGAPAVASGPIYLQSHWGSGVQFKNPAFDATKVTCPLP